MTRTVKPPDVRRSEILAAAGELFQTQGFNDTPVDAIIQKAGIAKGTFYYYFQSKEDVLAAIAHQLVLQIVERARHIAANPALSALEKARLMLRDQGQTVAATNPTMMKDLHLPENRELHERINVETILEFGPVMAEVVEQGVREGVFQVEKPLETVQFLLAGSQFLMDYGLFNWEPKELAARAQAMQSIVERALSAETGSFAFLSNTNAANHQA
jgi:AcrR family transcriptional regulator